MKSALASRLGKLGVPCRYDPNQWYSFRIVSGTPIKFERVPTPPPSGAAFTISGGYLPNRAPKRFHSNEIWAFTDQRFAVILFRSVWEYCGGERKAHAHRLASMVTTTVFSVSDWFPSIIMNNPFWYWQRQHAEKMPAYSHHVSEVGVFFRWNYTPVCSDQGRIRVSFSEVLSCLSVSENKHRMIYSTINPHISCVAIPAHRRAKEGSARDDVNGM